MHLHGLRRMRYVRALTQAELAEQTGLTEAAVSRLERWHTTARPTTIRRLCDVLGCAPADLIEPERVTWGAGPLPARQSAGDQHPLVEAGR